MDILRIFPMLGSRSAPMDNRNPSATKKGPGRKASHGHKKTKSHQSKQYQRRLEQHTAKSQTDNVTNTPLKSATRGG
jgi:hypothetical protein